MAITGYFIDTNWRYREVLLGFEHLEGNHTGQSLVQTLDSILAKHNISDRVLAITTDNARNNATLTRELQQALDSANFCAKQGHIPCLAHVIQLSLKELFGKIRIVPDNDDVTTVWHDTSLLSLGSIQGIA